MHPDRLRIALGPQFPTTILEVSNKLFLFGINRYRRLPCRLKRADPRIDVLELRVAVGVVRALAGLAVRLQAEAQAAQQPSNQLLADGEIKLGQCTGEMTLALLTHSSAASGLPRIAY
jgi:hypothetical protein